MVFTEACMVSKQVVCTLLECFLVDECFSLQEVQKILGFFVRNAVNSE